MLDVLKPTSTLSVSAVGVPIYNLQAIKAAGVLVVPTIVADRQNFQEFSQRARLPDQLIDDVIVILSKHTEFHERTHVTIRSSVLNHYAGLLDEINVERNQSSLRYGLEAIYRSWFDETARANRYVYKIDDVSSTPAIYIQPAYSDSLRLATRTGLGDVTTSKNYSRSVCNTAGSFRPAYSALLRRVEAIMRYPTEVVFTNDRTPAVIDAKRDLITDLGIWRSLSDLLRDGVISELDYLMGINADMLVQFVTLAFSDPGSVLLEGGLPAAPGTAIGRLSVLSRFYPRQQRTGLTDDILVVNEVYPEDIDAIAKCTGVIATLGGMTSHAACACRGLERPLVINHSLSIDQSSGTLHHPMLPGPADHSWYACVNGSSGVVSFSQKPDLAAHYRVNENCDQYLDQVIRALQCFDDIVKFSSIPLESQLHLARLRSELRKVGAI
jgi:phosphohistidine swiveling domain-containing protein